MRNFQDTFKTRKPSLISLFSICMTVPLKTEPVNTILVNILFQEMSKKSNSTVIIIIPFKYAITDIQFNNKENYQKLMQV